MPTRILSIVIPDFPPTGMVYGAERSFADLAKNLGELGASVYAIEPIGLFASSMDASGFQHFQIQNGPFSLLRTTLHAARIARRSRCDVIFAYHSDHISSVIPAFFTSFLVGKPFFLGVLDDRLVTEDRLSLHELLSISITSESRLIHSARRFIIGALRRQACRRAICLTSTSHVASYAKRYLRPRGVYTIGRGVNEVWFENATENNVKVYDACFVGRIDPNKGISTLFGAWEKVVKARANAKLLVIGDAWPGLLPAYLKQVENLQISKNVSFAGYLPDEESIQRLLHSSIILVQPSKIEGLSRAVLEAMATGLPCILGDIPTAREIFEDAAVFVQTENQELLSKAILNLLDDRGRREELSKRSVSLAKKFSWRSVATRTLKIINTALPKRKRPFL